MKTLRDYIAETEQWIDEPQAGDAFDIELAPDHLIETVIVETTADGIVIEADEHLESLLESRGWLAEKIGTYGAVGYGGMGQTFFEKDQVAEHGGGIGPREHWQSMMDEEQELAIPGTKGMDDDQRHAAIMKHYPDAKRVGTTPGVYQTKSGQLVSGIQGVRHLKNETMDEGAMKDLDIELQDYKSMTPQEFERAYNMKKADWAMKHHDLIGKENLQVDWTGKTGFDYVRETSAYMSRMLELAGVADHRYDKQDDVYHEDQLDEINRRDFLKTAAAAGVVGGLGISFSNLGKQPAYVQIHYLEKALEDAAETNPKIRQMLKRVQLDFYAGGKPGETAMQRMAKAAAHEAEYLKNLKAMAEHFKVPVNIPNNVHDRTVREEQTIDEDQAADVVAKKELDIDASAKLGQAIDEESTCNMTAEGEHCPVHGLAECGSMEEAKYQGREVKLGKPFLTPGGPKKRSVYVKNPKGNVVKVNFGDPKMRIKKSNPKRRKSFRSRHNCANPGPRHKARFWSCRAW